MTYKKFGLWFYPELPPRMRVATRKDFIHPSGGYLTDFNFMVKCVNTDEYEAHVASESSLLKWEDHIAAGRVFIQQN